MSCSDIFSFWADVPGEARVHPADKVVMGRDGDSFEKDCLPGPFKGPLKTAPVVLLFLSPGFEEIDRHHAKSAKGQEYYRRQRSGTALLPSEDEHKSSAQWTKRILTQFEFEVDYDSVRSKVAILNICPYKSKKFDDHHMLVALPSSRTAVSWAQEVLFEEARTGKRIVICLRSPKYWGLGQKGCDGDLFFPGYTRNGVMTLGPMREEIVKRVRERMR